MVLIALLFVACMAVPLSLLFGMRWAARRLATYPWVVQAVRWILTPVALLLYGVGMVLQGALALAGLVLVIGFWVGLIVAVGFLLHLGWAML